MNLERIQLPNSQLSPNAALSPSNTPTRAQGITGQLIYKDYSIFCSLVLWERIEGYEVLGNSVPLNFAVIFDLRTGP